MSRQYDRGGKLAYGYYWGNCEKLLVNYNEAEVVRTIFYLYDEQGYGFKRIAKKLTADAVPAPRFGSVWYHTGVKEILSRRARYEGKEQDYPAILATGIRSTVQENIRLRQTEESLTDALEESQAQKERLQRENELLKQRLSELETTQSPSQVLSNSEIAIQLIDLTIQSLDKITQQIEQDSEGAYQELRKRDDWERAVKQVLVGCTVVDLRGIAKHYGSAVSARRKDDIIDGILAYTIRTRVTNIGIRTFRVTDYIGA